MVEMLFRTLIVLCLISTSAFAETWFVRKDGGTRYSAKMVTGQCDGTADSAYPGHGVNRHCAFNDFRYLWDDRSYGNAAWVIRGGDTVILDNTEKWAVGFDQGNGGSHTWCFGGQGNSACFNPPIPSGTAAQHTRILGRNYANCGSATTTDRAKLTQIYGRFGVSMTLNLTAAQYVDLACLEITSHSQCTQHGLYRGNTYPGGCRTAYPVDDFAQNGIFTDTNTHDVAMQDVWIHGFPTRGIIGPIGGLVTATRTTLSYNAFTGWDFDDGRSTPSGNNATLRASYLTVEYSGCLQEYPITHHVPIIACYDDVSGGQGDGFGTPPTRLNVACDHCDFHYNTQDGADFGHVSLSSISFTNSIAYGNMGGTFKSGPNTSFVLLNSVSINNCLRLSAPLGDAPRNYNQAMGDYCRASGDQISFNFPSGTQATAMVANNTIVGYGSSVMDVQCQLPPGGATMKASTCPRNFTFRANIVLGYQKPSYNDGLMPGMWNTISPNMQDHNMFYRIRQTPSRFDENKDPLFLHEPSNPISSESALDDFNYHPGPGSAVKGAGVPGPVGLSQ